jgi:hypothetical protein
MGDAWVMWGYGPTAHKNLQYLQNIAADPVAAAAMAFFCVHGYASDGISAPSANPTTWNWWANGWMTPPSAGLPSNVKGFTYYGKKSWMTETSGENPAWLYPATGYPSDGAWGVALRIHQALTTGQQSAWIYWLMTDGGSAAAHNLTDSSLQANAPKYVAAKHYFKYIRPNAVRVAANVSGSTNILASAYLHETNQTLTAVLLNTRSNAISVTLNLPAQPANISVLRSFTSSQNSLWQSASLNVTNQAVQVTVPGYGIVTLYGVAPPRLNARTDAQGRINLYWMPASVGFRVQTATGLNPASWQMDASPITLSNGVASVSLPPAAGATFYRLVLP